MLRESWRDDRGLRNHNVLPRATSVQFAGYASTALIFTVATEHWSHAVVVPFYKPPAFAILQSQL